MNRHLTTHDITWFLEANRNGQLDLDPPYQRRSVWTRKDRQFFLDTMFRNYPTPAIFLHKSVDDNGRPTYHVVDGKQRIQTVLLFSQDKIRISDDFGDARLNSRKWTQLKGETDLRNQFWNYKFVVEEIDLDNSTVVNDIFDRINRNARKLTRQELRHAKYDGWFIQKVEHEAENPEWRKLGVVTQGREKRMNDSQFLSELLLIVIEGKMSGFNQDALDDAYAEYDDITHEESDINEDDFMTKCTNAKAALLALEEHNNIITKSFKSLASIYTIWSILVLEPEHMSTKHIANTLNLFANPAAITDSLLQTEAQSFTENLRGASTDLAPRNARYKALAQALKRVPDEST